MGYMRQGQQLCCPCNCAPVPHELTDTGCKASMAKEAVGHAQRRCDGRASVPASRMMRASATDFQWQPNLLASTSQPLLLAA